MARLRSFLFIAVAAIFILVFAPQAWDTLVGGWYWLFPVDRPSNAVTSTERAKELAAKGLRDQLVTLNNIQSLDGSKYQLFAMGIGQITLKKPEVVPVTVTGSREPRRDYKSNTPLTTVTSQQVKDSGEVEASRPQQVYGDFNNIVIVDRKANTFTPLFDKRVAISRFQTGWRTPQDILIIFGTDTDSDHDGDIGYGDLEDIFIYTFADKRMHRIAVPGMGAGSLYDLPNADYLIVQYLVDRNHDGKIGSYYSDTGEEPSTFMRIDLKTFEATPFVPDDVVRRLQSTLQATPAPQPAAPAP